MRKTTKLLASLITVLTLFASTSVQANAEWKSDSTGYWYTSGSIYLTGWHSIDGNWYYFYSDGYMAHDCWIEGYYLNSNGSMATGWIKESNDWYYLKENGAMATGWVYVKDKWYYLNSNGSMVYNTTINGYRVGADGAMI